MVAAEPGFCAVAGTDGQTKSLLFRTLKPADPAIEIPEFHVTPIDKLARGLHGVHVGIGLDRFVRGYAIVSINQVRSIGRHDPLPSPRQRAEERERRTWSHAGIDGTRIVKRGTRQKRLRHKGIMETGPY